MSRHVAFVGTGGVAYRDPLALDPNKLTGMLPTPERLAEVWLYERHQAQNDRAVSWWRSATGRTP